MVQIVPKRIATGLFPIVAKCSRPRIAALQPDLPQLCSGLQSAWTLL